MSDNLNKHANYGEFLAEKHSKLNTPIETIDTVVQKAVGSLPITRNKLVKGENNEVYDVATENGRNVIVRVSRRTDAPPFDSERWALEQCRKAGVPVPEILDIERMEVDEKPLTLCVETKLEGEMLGDIREKIPSGRLHKLINNAGEVLSKIHTIPTLGFGQLNGMGEGNYTTWEDYMRNQERRRDKLVESAKRTDIVPESIDTALLILREHRELYQGVAPRLLHNDFSPKHLFVKDDQIVGVIDMEDAKGGNPVYELARWDFFYDDSIPVEWLREGYADKSLFDANFKTNYELCRLYQSLIFLNYYERENNRFGVDRSRQNLQRGVDYFKAEKA